MNPKIDTGVAWCALSVPKDIELLLAVARERISETIDGIVIEQGDLLPFAELFLELLIKATTLAQADGSARRF